MVLKEVFLIKNDVKIFHYSEHPGKDETHFILSSGFFSAIKSFTLEMRDSKIDFFASENEYFIFDRIEEHDTDIVCIFNNSIEQTVARIIMTGILEILGQAKVLSIPQGKNITGTEHKKLTKDIRHLANSVISPEYQSQAAKSIFDENKQIKFLGLYDVRKDKTYFSSQREVDVDEEMLSKTLIKLYRNINKMLGRLGFGNRFEIVQIESFNGFGLIYNFRGVLIVCHTSDQVDGNDLYIIPFKILSISDPLSIEEKYGSLFNETRWIYDFVGNLVPIRGVVADNVDGEVINQSIQSLDSLNEVLQLESYHLVTIYTEQPNISYLQFMKNNTTSENIIDLYY